MGRVRDQQRDFYFDRYFFTRLWTLAPLLYPSVEWAALATGAALGTSIAQEFVNYYTGLLIGKFYSALLNKNESRFWELFWHGTLMYLGQSALIALMAFCSWIVYLAWRRNLVTALHQRYFANKNYFRLNAIDNDGIDNPDQRITQDVEKMCRLLAISILPKALIGPCVVGWYTWKVWQTAGPLGAGVIYGYFIVGTVANRLLISPLTKWGARVERKEGDFRYKHVTVREHAEESASYSAGKFEREECDSALQVIPIFWLHDYSGMDLGSLAEKISNNAFQYIYLVQSFTRMADTAILVGECSSYVQRIAALFTSCSEVETRFATQSPPQMAEGLEEGKRDQLDVSHLLKSSGLLLEVHNLGYSLPNDEKIRLIAGLNLEIPFGKSLVVTGKSGVGKSSFFRVLTRLWPHQNGFFHLGVPPKSVLFVSQRPYFPSGQLSLRQQILFPHNSRKFQAEITIWIPDDARILSILVSLELGHLTSTVGGLDSPVSFEWQDTLTPGEQQRLSFARVLIHRPALVLLDEATNSVSNDMEQRMYSLLKENGIVYFSAGHKHTLLDFHDYELRLNSKSEYKFRALSNSLNSQTSSVSSQMHL